MKRKIYLMLRDISQRKPELQDEGLLYLSFKIILDYCKIFFVIIISSIASKIFHSIYWTCWREAYWIKDVKKENHYQVVTNYSARKKLRVLRFWISSVNWLRCKMLLVIISIVTKRHKKVLLLKSLKIKYKNCIGNK